MASSYDDLLKTKDVNLLVGLEEKDRVSPQSVGYTIWEPWISVENVMSIQPVNIKPYYCY